MPVAFVQEADASSSSVTLGASATAGNTLVVAVACLGPTSATGVTGVTLGGSPDNFALLTPGPSAHDTTSPGDYISVTVWADANCVGGSAAVAVTGTGVLAVWAYEFSGLSGTADLARVFAVSTYQDSWVTALGETTLPAEAWFAITCAANQAGAETLTVNNVTGWTLETAHSGTSGSYDWGAVSAYQAVNTLGTPAWSGAFSQGSFSVTVLVTLPMAQAGTASAPVAPATISLPSGTVITGSGSPQPADAGYAAWSYDPVMLTGAVGFPLATAGSIYLVKCPVRAPVACSGIRILLTAGGSGLLAGENYAGIYNSAGTLIGATGDQTSAWAPSGIVDASLTDGPVSIPAPFVWAAFVFNATSSGPALAATARLASLASWSNGRLAQPAARFGVLNLGAFSLPSVITPANISFYAAEYWAGLW